MDIELRGISKRFGPVIANSDVHLSIRAGEILGLLGENGAGKSVLMGVLSGIYRPDAGEIVIDGKPVQFRDASEAIHAGIGMVHQHFKLVSVFTVAENVVLGAEPTGPLDHLEMDRAREEVRAISARFGLEVDPDAIVEQLPVGIQQRVEIIKVLFRSADVLIFDEPTAVLTPQEVVDFFAVMRSLRQAGKAIVFITHKLREVLEIADRISVLRGGKIVGETDARSATAESLAEMMVGRPIRFVVDKKPLAPGAPLLEIRALRVTNERREVALHDVSLTVHEREIVGIAGVQGNGQSELVEALTGLRHPAAGRVLFLGKDITFASSRLRHHLGIAHIPEDRQRDGMIGEFTVAENMVLDSYYEPRFSSGIAMKWDAVEKEAARTAAEFDVRADSIMEEAEHLSGGNQQKMVVAREMSRDTRLLIASQPTRGIDIGAIENIHKRIVAARDEGDGVLLVSTELDEILALADRILVIFRGRIVGEFDPSPANVGQIGLAMAGATALPAPAPTGSMEKAGP